MSKTSQASHVYHRAPTTISRDTIKAAEIILSAAQTGQCIGMGVVLLFKRRKFMVEVIGDAISDPVFMRGALQSLDDALHDIVHGRIDIDLTTM